jgi:hypothetical protein
MDTVKALSTKADSFVRPVLKNPYAMTAIKIILTLYAAQLAPRLPHQISSLFTHTFVKILALFVIAYLSDLDFQLAILLAIVFVLGTNILAGRGVFESYANYSKDYTPDEKHKLIEPKLHVYPGCLNVKLEDLLKAFEGDNIKLQKTVVYAYQELVNKVQKSPAKEQLISIAHAAGLPYNVEVNDENAPFIATLLMYVGFKFPPGCIPPQ